MPYAITILAAILFGLIVYVLLFEDRVGSVTVFEHEKGLLFRRGTFEKLLEPGLYRVYGPARTITRIDMRPFAATVPETAAHTADRALVRITVGATVKVKDPRAAVLATGDFREAIGLELATAARDLAASWTVPELVERAAGIGKSLVERTAGRAGAMGLQVLSAGVLALDVRGGVDAGPPGERGKTPGPRMPEIGEEWNHQ